MLFKPVSSFFIVRYWFSVSRWIGCELEWYPRNELVNWYPILIRPNCLSRISLSDIWEPATREACGNNLWKMFKKAISILFTKSILQVFPNYCHISSYNIKTSLGQHSVLVDLIFFVFVWYNAFIPLLYNLLDWTCCLL